MEYGANKLTASRQLFPKEDEDLSSKTIREEMRKDQEEFKRKYNYDPIEDKPIPGKYVYTFDEAKGILIGRPKSQSNDDAIIETNETDDNHKDNFKTPKKENDQASNENGLDLESEARGISSDNDTK